MKNDKQKIADTINNDGMPSREAGRYVERRARENEEKGEPVCEWDVDSYIWEDTQLMALITVKLSHEAILMYAQSIREEWKGSEG